MNCQSMKTQGGELKCRLLDEKILKIYILYDSNCKTLWETKTMEHKDIRVYWGLEEINR